MQLIRQIFYTDNISRYRNEDDMKGLRMVRRYILSSLVLNVAAGPSMVG